MTITRRASTSFDVDGTNSHATETDTNSGSPATSNTQAKTGTYSLRIGTTSYVTFTVPATRQIRGGVFVHSAGGYNGSAHFLAVRSASDNLWNLEIPSANTTVDLIVGASKQDDFAHAFPDSGFWHLGFDCKINSSAGWIKIYVDGTEVAAYTGNTGNADIVQIVVGCNSGASNYLNSYTYYDDFYYDDTAGESAATVPPGYQFYFLVANGNGASSEMAGSDGNSTDNYALVDDSGANDGDTTYVLGTTAGLQDTYALTTYTIPTDYAVTAVLPVAIARKTGTEDCQLEPALYSGSTAWTGTAVALGTSYKQVFQERVTIDPDNSGAWSQSAIDALEAGAETYGAFT